MDSGTKERRDLDQGSRRDSHRDRKRDNSRERDGERSHRHHHRHSRRHHRDHDRSRSRSRDRRRDRDGDSDRHHHKKRSQRDDDDKDRRHRKSRKVDLHPDAKQDKASPDPEIPRSSAPKRDAWMTEPATDFIDYTQKGAHKPASQPSRPDYHPVIHRNELNTQLKEGKSLDQYADADGEGNMGYTFGDAGSKWRMMKLKRVYEFAKDEGRTIESVALERYGDLRAFDEAREEETELERRQVYGEGRDDAKTQPTGELYRERMVKAEAEYERQASAKDRREELTQGKVTEITPSTTNPAALDQTAFNKMRALLMKAQLRGDPKAAEMEKEYNEAIARSLAAKKNEPEVVVLSAMDSRLLAGLDGRVGKEVIEGKRGKLVDKDDMSLDDMVREEKRTRGQDSLDYLDENASRLAKRVQRSGVDLKNMAIGEFNKMQRVLDTCPLCQHEDKPSTAPVVALATRVFLTLPTEPELVPGGAVIVPIQHKVNMMECDDDEWEEVRNFMKSLVRMYDSRNLDVIFYENAASPWRKRHAAIVVVPLPRSLGETAPAFFKEAILSSDEEWSQHKKIIDTLARSRQGLGKLAFRRSLVKEMPYFHVWFEIDGGMGHVIEDENRWPRGDLFAREVLGGMLDVEASTIKRQGRWNRGRDARVDGFRAGWDKFDWTKVLYDN